MAWDGVPEPAFRSCIRVTVALTSAPLPVRDRMMMATPIGVHYPLPHVRPTFINKPM
jgi:hypothetical protein